MASDSPAFVNSDQESIAEQPLPPRRAARKRPPPTPEAGGRKPTPSKRTRAGDDEDDDDALPPVDETQPLEVPPVVVPPPVVRPVPRDTSTAQTRRSRRQQQPPRREEKEEEAPVPVPPPPSSRRSAALWVVVVTWCLSWLALVLRSEAPRTARWRFRERLVAELRATDAWRAHDQYRRDLNAFQQSVVDVSSDGLRKLLADAESSTAKLDALSAAFPTTTVPDSLDDDASTLRAAAAEASAAAKALLAKKKKKETPHKGRSFEAAQTVAAKLADEKAVTQETKEAALSAARERGAAEASHSTVFGSARAVEDSVAAKLEAALRADETFDYASARTGGAVLAANTSAAYKSTTRPTTVIATDGGGGDSVLDLAVGSCWAFPGDSGVLALKLAVPTKPTKVALQHVSPAATGFGDASAAPKRFQLLGFPTLLEHDGTFDLGTFHYDAAAGLRQVFPVTPPPVDLAALKLKVLDNHGNANYTCLYRLAVY